MQRDYTGTDLEASSLLSSFYGPGWCYECYQKGKSYHHTYPDVNSVSYCNEWPNQTCPLKQKCHKVTGVANYFLAEFKTHCISRNPYPGTALKANSL